PLRANSGLMHRSKTQPSASVTASGSIRPSSMQVCFQSLRATLIGSMPELPPGFFVTGAMHRAVMRAAERDGKFIARFAAERARLHKSNVMRIRGFAATQQARLLHHKAKVVPVAIAAGRRHREYVLIDGHLIGAGFIRLANLLATCAQTFKRIDVLGLSAFGRQELG